MVQGQSIGEGVNLAIEHANDFASTGITNKRQGEFPVFSDQQKMISTEILGRKKSTGHVTALWFL